MRHDSYAWRADDPAAREAMLRFGPTAGPTILILPPLFEEANRMRRILVQVMRRLAAVERASVLPDLPGTGDSPVATVDARLDHWQAAVRALAATLPRPLVTLAVRGGALLDDAATPDARWRLAPASGKALVRDMLRATALTGEANVAALETAARARITQLAGNRIDPALFTALEQAAPSGGAARIAALGDDADADVAFTAAPPWRRAEPGDDDDLVRAIADDIATWSKTCVAS